MVVAAAPPRNAPQGANFAANTALIRQQMGDIVKPAGGGTVTVQLPRVGLLARVLLAIRGSVAGTLTVPNPLGFSSIINRVRLTVNAGVDIVNLSGAGYHYGVREMIESEFFDPLGQSNARSAVTAAAFNLDMVLPISVNMRDPVGLLNLQDMGATFSLAIDFNADANVATGATVTCTVTPYLDLFTVPPNPNDMPNLRVIHSMIEDARAVAAAGDFTYDWLRGMQYLQLFHGLGIGAAGADGFSKVALRIQQQQFPWSSDVKALDIDHRQLRGRARPAGGIYIDRLATSGLGNYGTVRDVFDSSKTTDAATVITSTGAATLYTVRRGLQIIPAPQAA
jgi:hypothetical protein